MAIKFYKKQAKKLLRDVKNGDPTAISRINRYLTMRSVSLMNCQHIVARECGYINWKALLDSQNE